MAVKVRERPKGSGTWWVFIDHKGKRKSKKIGTDKRTAVAVAEKIQAKLILGQWNLDEQEKPVSTFGEYAKTWFGVTLPATTKRGTQLAYESAYRTHVKPVFRHVPVTDIKRHDIKQFLMDKANQGYAHSGIGRMKNILGGVLALAVDDETLPANPALRLGKIHRKRTPPKIDPLTREELAVLLDTFRVHHPRFYALILLLARTGLRIGEAVALEWGDIDFRGRFIRVQRRVYRGQVSSTKNHKIRTVDMSQQLTATLKALSKQRKEEKLQKGWESVPDLVFVGPNAGRIDVDSWRRLVFYPALEKAGLRRVRVHDLRHSYASMLLQNKTSLAYIKDQLGHHSISVTVDIYGHLVPGQNRDAVDALDDFGPATGRNLSATSGRKTA